MAVPPEAASTLPLPKSFADILSSPSSSSISLKPPERFKGMLAISFSKQEIELFAQSYKFALIGKFPHGRPTMAVFRKSFDAIGFGGVCSIGLIDQKHFLLNFDREDDFQRCWLRKSWSINGFQMKVFKWSPDFRPDIESPVVPVWIALEGLPAHLQDKRAVFAIANLIGKPLKVDSSTLSHNRPSVARICVELDVSKVLPDVVWINNGEYGGFSQPIKYEFIPDYCTDCKKFGHLRDACNRHQKQPHIPLPKTQTSEQTTAPLPPTVAPPKKRWRKVDPQRNLEAPLIVENPHPQPSSLDHEAFPESAQTADAEPPLTNSLSTAQDLLDFSSSPTLGRTLIDDQCIPNIIKDSSLGHLSEGEQIQVSKHFSKALLDSWKNDSKLFSRKLLNLLNDDTPDDGFIPVTGKKRRPRKDYSTSIPSVTTRLADGTLSKVSFPRRWK